MMGEVHLLPGTTFSSVGDRGRLRFLRGRADADDGALRGEICGQVRPAGLVEDLLEERVGRIFDDPIPRPVATLNNVVGGAVGQQASAPAGRMAVDEENLFRAVLAQRRLIETARDRTQEARRRVQQQRNRTSEKSRLARAGSLKAEPGPDRPFKPYA
jgi:hypothetical protein